MTELPPDRSWLTTEEIKEDPIGLFVLGFAIILATILFLILVVV